jgi:CRP-like cAMP-binding protein
MPPADNDIPRAALAALENSRIFGALQPDSLHQLAATGHVLHLERGSSLFTKGDEGDAAFILLEGELEVRSLSKEGRELRIAALKSGELIGEMAVLDGAPRSADVVAARTCRLWRLPRLAVLALLLADKEVALRVMAELCRRLRASNTALQLASRRTMEGQLAALLIAEKNRLGFVALTQTEMARRIGSSREQVNRKLHSWREIGWVAVEKQGVQVRQPASLQGLVT